MLKFISNRFKCKDYGFIISIHPMLKFILKAIAPSIFYTYFNTSHVKVYLSVRELARIKTKISIHPMLKFIKFFQRQVLMLLYFNTSHVKVYQTARDSGDDRNEISKHPMLKLIRQAALLLRVRPSISKHPMLKLIIFIILCSSLSYSFQNIPC